MTNIGGFFPIEQIGSEKNNFFSNLCSSKGEIKFLLSGRCAIFYVLEDYKDQDKIKVAYVPKYTCETVLDPFIKSGYKLIFYEIDTTLSPNFSKNALEEASVILISGYYGFSTYSKAFVDKCKNKQICIIQDTTQTIFSKNGIYKKATYVVGSLRKWIGISSGGFAIKTNGTFTKDLLVAPKSHLDLRKEASELKLHALNKSTSSSTFLEEANNKFWEAEIQLRKIYYHFKSDSFSDEIVNTFDFNHLKAARRSNYTFLAENFPISNQWSTIFPTLHPGIVPSHFVIYVEKRSIIQEFLKKKNIYSTVYWPKPPPVSLDENSNTKYVYDHILAIPCDQRYNISHMEFICKSFAEFSLYSNQNLT